MVGFANLAVLGLLILVVIFAIIWDDKHATIKAEYRYLEFNLGIEKIIPDSVEENLVDLEIMICEALGLGMGGTSYDFMVEDMTMLQAKYFVLAIEAYLKSHDIKSSIQFKARTEKDD